MAQDGEASIVFVVTFDAGSGTFADGNNTKDVAVALGNKVNPPDLPSHAFNTFKGWYNDSEEYNFSDLVFANITLYAVWDFNETAFASWLSGQSGGASNADPIAVALAIDLGTMTSSTSNWQKMLSAINIANKYVDLDLSSCTMDGTAFNPVYSVTTGKDHITGIVLPDVAKSIPDASTSTQQAFRNFSELKTFSARGLISIGNYAFLNVDKLTKVDLSAASALTSIGYVVFRGCTNLQEISLPASLDTIGTYAFYASGLKSIDLSNASGLISIRSYTFAICSKLEEVKLPSGLTSIEKSAFEDCSELTNIFQPTPFSIIGASAFENCSKLTSVSILATATINSNSFIGCTSLTSFNIVGTGSLSAAFDGKALIRNTTIVAYPSASGNIFLPAGFYSIGEYAFSKSNVTFVSTPTNLVSIDNLAFSDCKQLQSIFIKDVEFIGWNAFEICTDLDFVSMPSVKTISGAAFYGCSKLVDITLPEVLDFIGDSAFENCINLISITCMSEIPPQLASDYSIFYESDELRIYVPQESADEYRNEWPNYQRFIYGIK